MPVPHVRAPVRHAPPPAPASPDHEAQWEAFEAFAFARQVMNRAFMAWMETQPDADDVRAELSATTSALRQLREIVK